MKKLIVFIAMAITVLQNGYTYDLAQEMRIRFYKLDRTDFNGVKIISNEMPLQILMAIPAY